MNLHPFLFGALLLIPAFGFHVLAAKSWSVMSGWDALAKKFQLQKKISNPMWKLQSGKFRYGIRYSLSIDANSHGLYLAIPVIGRLSCHPPLFIPWSEISMTKIEGTLGDRMRLTLDRELQIPLTINYYLAQNITEARHRDRAEDESAS